MRAMKPRMNDRHQGEASRSNHLIHSLVEQSQIKIIENRFGSDYLLSNASFCRFLAHFAVQMSSRIELVSVRSTRTFPIQK